MPQANQQETTNQRNQTSQNTTSIFSPRNVTGCNNQQSSFKVLQDNNKIVDRPGSTQLGRSAFDWDVYKSRRSALNYLRRHKYGTDTIIETEDGSCFELVHSQVISAFGDRINDYIRNNGTFIDTNRMYAYACNRGSDADCLDKENHSKHETAKTVIHRSSALQRLDEAGLMVQIINSRQLGLGRWPGKIKLIRLPKLNQYTINILVECAYTGYIKTDLPSGGIWQVLEMAEYYEMAEVIRACCAFLIKNLDRSNCIHFYHVGIKYRHTLQRCAWHKIRANFKYILAQNLRMVELQNYDLVSEAPHNDSYQFGEMSSRSPVNDMRVALTSAHQQDSGLDQYSLASIKFEHFEPLLMNDKLNVDNEECIWYAIKLWCNYNLADRASKVVSLLPCMRFPRLKSGTEFSARFIWHDPLISGNKQAQQQLAILDRNHRDFLSGHAYMISRDGFSLPCSPNPRQLRPRIPHSILLAIGGWQQGQPTTLIESYDSNCNMWFEHKKRITMPLAYHGIECVNGVLYICGGTDGTEILNELFVFDPIRGDCSQKPSMREARCYVSTSFLDGFLYAIGGHNGAQRMKSVERFDIVNEAWCHVRDMNVARSDASACVHDSKIFIAGGLNEQVIENSVEFYNHKDDSWTFLASMNTPRTSFTLILYQGSLLAIGGNNGSERLASVEQYNFQSRSWTHHSNMRHRRSTFSAALIDENKLIVIGGYNGQAPFNQVEMYDDRERAWVVLQKIRYDRSGLRAVVISDLPNAADYTYLGHNMSSLGGATHN